MRFSRVARLALCAAMVVGVSNASADEGGFGAALGEASLVSSYYQFARRCQIVGAISHEELLGFRQRLLNALYDKYSLNAEDEAQIAQVIDDDSVVIATAGLPLSHEVCARFISSL